MFGLSYRLFFVAFGDYERHAAEQVSWNLVPFSTLLNYIRYLDHYGFTIWSINLFGNIAAFIPFGFFMGLIFQKCRARAGLTFLLTLAFSFFVESIQAWFRVGSFDVDDILLNGLGGLIGWWMSRWIRRFQT